MNIWDSVQRGLEKATQEATRRAKTLRLRTTIDKLTEQLHTQEDTLIVRTMEVFAAGQLIQGELIPICQELIHLQQQMEQAQRELKQIQSQGQPDAGPQLPAQPATRSYPAGGDLAPTLYAPPPPPPDYKPYDHTMPAPLPPPPPGVEPSTISSFETMRVDTPASEKQFCLHCRSELIPGDAYCHNCGTAVQSGNTVYQLTVRSGTEESDIAERETVRASIDGSEDTPPTSIIEQASKETDEANSSSHKKDGGH